MKTSVTAEHILNDMKLLIEKWLDPKRYKGYSIEIVFDELEAGIKACRFVQKYNDIKETEIEED